MPEYTFDRQQLESDEDLNNLWDYIMYFRWLINAVFIGFPVWNVIFIGLLWNIWFNIVMNHFWAHGNLYLMLMTVLNIVQSVNASYLVFEIPAFLRWTKPFRSLSLEYAIIMNIIYIGFVVRWR